MTHANATTWSNSTNRVATQAQTTTTAAGSAAPGFDLRFWESLNALATRQSYGNGGTQTWIGGSSPTGQTGSGAASASPYYAPGTGSQATSGVATIPGLTGGYPSQPGQVATGGGQTPLYTSATPTGGMVVYGYFWNYYPGPVQLPYGQAGTTPTTGVAPVATPGLDNGAEVDYSVSKVGELERAPMAMFEHDGELVMSVISRNEMDETPIYTYSEEEGVQLRSELPDWAESGNYGWSFGDGLHVVAESWEGMVDYTAESPDGPWTAHEYSDLNPQRYKNLKWGFGYQDPETGEQFLGFGNNDKPGVVLQYKDGAWQTYTAPDDMLFPTSLDVITDGEYADYKLVASSTYGDTRVHLVSPDGEAQLVGQYGSWGYLRTDDNARMTYLATEEGKVYYSSFDDPTHWQEAKYEDADGKALSSLGRCGEMNVHPTSGRVILPSADDGAIGVNRASGEAATNLYEAVATDGEVTFRQVARIEGAGLWELRSAVVGDDLYFGTGVAGNREQDLGKGAIYKIEASGSAVTQTPVTRNLAASRPTGGQTSVTANTGGTRASALPTGVTYQPNRLPGYQAGGTYRLGNRVA